MEFAFGANWADYSRFVGSIFGAPLAAEGLLAFFLESTFLGVLLFGRKKVSKGFYYASAWLVMIGTLLSAVWILIANSWQQTPAGYADRRRPGRCSPTSGRRRSTRPSRRATCTPSWPASSPGASSWPASAPGTCSRSATCTSPARRWSPRSSSGSLASAAMPFIGHWHALEVAEYQPVKMAAFENLDETQNNAPLYLFGWVNGDGGHHRRQHPQRPEPDARPEPGPRDQGSRHRPAR